MAQLAYSAATQGVRGTLTHSLLDEVNLLVTIVFQDVVLALDALTETIQGMRPVLKAHRWLLTRTPLGRISRTR